MTTYSGNSYGGSDWRGSTNDGDFDDAPIMRKCRACGAIFDKACVVTGRENEVGFSCPDCSAFVPDSDLACADCDGEGRTPNWSGTGDDAGGYADFCSTCKGTGVDGPTLDESE